jgi:putative GTP pyrophosphokinase
MRQFLDDYAKYVSEILEPTRKEIESVLFQWRDPAYWVNYPTRSRMPAPSPIQRVHIRIKRPESVVDKIVCRPSDFPEGLASPSFRKMNDAIGARVVLYFLSGLPLINRELGKHASLEISPQINPVAYLSGDLADRFGLSGLDRRTKNSGYASVHYIVRLRESSVCQDNRPWWELQVRTLLEDVWAEIEHILGYKPNKRTSFAVRKQFQIISRELIGVDEHFNFLYEELSRFQEEVIFKDADPLNAENLPPVLDELGLGCAQREIDGLLKVLASRGVHAVGSLRLVATSRRLETIRHTYTAEAGRPPNNFEMVANLANLVGCGEGGEEIERIKAQISFLQVWEQLKRAGLT